MSKSKKNVVDPEFIIKNYGADAVRLFILSDSPPEKDVQWSEQGMASSYKFIQKLWILHNEIKNKISNEKNIQNNIELEKFTNQLISKITNNLEKFNYNVIIANMYATYNYLINYLKNNYDLKNLKENYVKILNCFAPVIPHFATECLAELKHKEKMEWPSYNKALIEDEKTNVVIQINGKKRSILNINKGLSEKEVFGLSKKEKSIEKYIKEKEIKKIIFIQDKLINILINE